MNILYIDCKSWLLSIGRVKEHVYLLKMYSLTLKLNGLFNCFKLVLLSY